MRDDSCTNTLWRFGALFLGFALLLLAGCQQKPVRYADTVASSKANNLRYADCNKHIRGNPSPIPPVVIAVDPNDGLAPQDEVIFVCTGEPVSWEVPGGAGSSVQSFTIQFQNNEWPFPGAPQTLQGTGQAGTAARVVGALPANLRSKPYKYSIQVTRTNNTSVTLDPVLIPMGN